MYKQHEEIPDLGFVPDSSFPLSYAEKALLQVKLKGPGAAKLRINCGGAPNVVPGKAEYVGSEADALVKVLDQLEIPFTREGDKTIVHGRSVHASTAYDGQNAITLLAKGLVGFQPHPMISFLAEKVGRETNGFSLFGEVKDDITGELTLNVGNLVIDDEHSEAILDLRIPVEKDPEEILAGLQEISELYGLEYDIIDQLPSLHVPKDSELVQTLMNVYQEKTGDMDSKPQTGGGATYARSMPNMVAFGAHFPDSVSLAHQVNEGIKLEEFYQAMDIYAEAIYRLCVKE
jgi:predicted dipeptidase